MAKVNHTKTVVIADAPDKSKICQSSKKILQVHNKKNEGLKMFYRICRTQHKPKAKYRPNIGLHRKKNVLKTKLYFSNISSKCYASISLFLKERDVKKNHSSLFHHSFDDSNKRYSLFTTVFGIYHKYFYICVVKVVKVTFSWRRKF